MKQRTETLFVGIIHQKDDEDDFVDINFITLSKESANEEMRNTKNKAINVYRLKCVIDREDYILCKSIDEREMLESFYVERVVLIKGVKNGEKQ